MKKFTLPLLATSLALVLGLLVLSPAQNAEARAPQPHELNPDEPGVLCWNAHVSADTDNDAVADFGWNVATGPDPDVCISTMQTMVIQANSQGWTVYDRGCTSYTESPACTIESIN